MTRIKLLRGTPINWETTNPVLEAGEPGYEIGTGQMKVGDGVRRWNNLPYAGSSAAVLDSHINSSMPHPIYDDGPSFVLLYENAKV